ncbi:MAG: CxxC-x17-CxxC domain-containing protein, partial [Candidatus Liptonbacteria bacterium]
ICVVDPHGELIEAILGKIPEERMKDVIYFNPADPDYHIGFNILELPNPKYKHLVASGLMGIFTKIWANVWSARMEYILNNAVLALLDTPGSTLLGIPRLLVDKEYRAKIIANINDPVVKAFWVNEYEQWQEKFRNEAIAPIQNKVGQFLSTALIRNIVGQSKSTIDIFEIMNTGKIFLVDVSKGRIGEDNSDLLGAMLVTKIQLSAMERVRVPEEDRRDFYLYVDEFQNFATDSFASILSEARKYRLNLIIAHQYIGQLITDMSTKVRDAVFGNVGTMIIFRAGAADAEFLEKEFEPEFAIQDLVNLPNYHIYLKLMVDGVTCRPFSAITLLPFQVKNGKSQIPAIIELSRKNYCRPGEVVEKEIRRWSGMTMPDENGSDTSYVRAEEREASSRHPAKCALCGKNISLPFEPTPGRPVYCKSCFAKVKATGLPGELIAEERRIRPREEGYAPELASMGIEYDNRQNTPLRTSIFDHPELEEAPAAVKESSGTLSLSKLKQSEKTSKHNFQKQEVNIEELRSAISESLNRAIKQPPNIDPSKEMSL